MKNFLVFLIISLLPVAVVLPAENADQPSQPRVKEVCRETKEKKKVCKKIKIHKKLDGKEVPKK